MRPGRERPASTPRIHIEPLSHLLDEVGRLLARRELFVRLHPAAAAGRILQLFPCEEPARRSSTARRHDTSSCARAPSAPAPTTSPPRPRAPPLAARRRPGHAPSPPGVRGTAHALARRYLPALSGSRPPRSRGVPQCSAPLVIWKRPGKVKGAGSGATKKRPARCMPGKKGGVEREGGADLRCWCWFL